MKDNTTIRFGQRDIVPLVMNIQTTASLTFLDVLSLLFRFPAHRVLTIYTLHQSNITPLKESIETIVRLDGHDIGISRVEVSHSSDSSNPDLYESLTSPTKPQ